MGLKTKIEQWSRWFNKHEALLFGLFTALHLLLIWLPAWFYTYDGPAHFHNSWLLQQILAGNNGWLKQWYQLNPNPEPNWLFYLLVMPLQWLLPFAMAEKVFASLYLLLFAFGFRLYVLKCQTSWKGWAAWPVFYFIFHFNFMLGQFNFALSMALLWWTLLFWENTLHNPSRKNWLLTLLFLWLGYSAHLVGFLASGLLMGIRLLAFHPLKLRARMQKLAGLAVISLPPLLLVWYFFSQKASDGALVWLPTDVLWERLWKLSALVVFNPQTEFPSFFPLIVLVFGGMMTAIWQQRQKPMTQLVWWATAFIFLLLYFSMPDETSGAGYLSSRLALVTTMLLGLAALHSLKHPDLKRMVLLSMVLGQLHLLAYYTRNEINMGKEMAEYQSGLKLLKPGSVVQQLNYSPQWMYEHFTEAIYQPQIVHLNNYEAFNNYFPLKWQNSTRETFHVHWKKLGHWPPCITPADLETLEKAEKPNYLLRWHYQYHQKRDCDLLLQNFLNKHYRRTFVSSAKNLEIFESIPNP